jgi:serine/threonine protein kinase
MMNVGDFVRTEEVIYRNSISGVTIFKAKHATTGLQAAWKEVNYPRPRSNRLNQEVSLQSKLTHPYISPILASQESSEQLILVSPLAETDLSKEILKRKSHFAPWTEQELSVLLAMCVQALAHCQRLGLSHRDIKPANIFLTAQGVVQLGDFGSAREIGTMEGKMSLVGTPLYLSPALKSALTSLTKPVHNAYKSDVYSLGLTFLHMARLEYPEEQERRSFDHYVRNLNYGEWLKTVLGVMLTEHEAERVDFIGLQAWTQDKIKPISSVFYRETSETACISCNSHADYICLCEFPVLVLCSSCVNSHSSAAHCLRPISEASKYCSKAALQRYIDRTAIITKVKTGLQATIEGAKSGLEELDRRCMEVIQEIKRIKEERRRELLDIKDKAEEILAKAGKELEEQRDEAGESWFSAWNAVELPYFTIKNTSFASADCIFPSLISTDHLDALSMLLQPPPIIPLLHKEQISLYFPHSHWCSFPLSSSLCIDSCTSLALANAELVLAVGGETHPRQVATISSVSGEVDRLGQCGTARKRAGVVVTLGYAFIFGGQNSEKSAEKLPLSCGKSCSLSSLPVPKHSFTPCLYSSHIYLPGPSIHIYDPAEDHYRLFTACGLPIQYCSCVVREDTLYCFTSLGTVWLDLRKSRPVVRTAAWGALQDWTLPVWAGNSVYFSGENKLIRLRMDTKEMTTLLQE